MPYQKFNTGRSVIITQSDTENITNPSEPKETIIATGAVISILNGALLSVSFPTPGRGYTSLGTLAVTMTGIPNTTLPTFSLAIGPQGTVLVSILTAGSGMTDGVYTSGSTYTMVVSGSGTTSNNVVKAQPCIVTVNCTVAGNVFVTTAGGDETRFAVPVGTTDLPVQCVRVWTTGSSATFTATGTW